MFVLIRTPKIKKVYPNNDDVVITIYNEIAQ
jgi:hypothetical protein